MHADTNIEGEGCRSCDRLERDLERADAKIKEISSKLDGVLDVVRGDWGINPSMAMERIIAIVDPPPPCEHARKIGTNQCIYCGAGMPLPEPPR